MKHVRLHDGRADKNLTFVGLGVGQANTTPDVQCGREGDQIDVRVASMVIDAQQRRSWTPS
ncbi:hypothetical protein GCM10023322_08610 [Rugosimonospora acidiphila]|uniref:Uncharacterized protein n=1 Tax=Rugosimonospora acidiphila TaxID=556531 RepID=A0ABP9RL53_9ACTN